MQDARVVRVSVVRVSPPADHHGPVVFPEFVVDRETGGNGFVVEKDFRFQGDDGKVKVDVVAVVVRVDVDAVHLVNPVVVHGGDAVVLEQDPYVVRNSVPDTMCRSQDVVLTDQNSTAELVE